MYELAGRLANRGELDKLRQSVPKAVPMKATVNIGTRFLYLEKIPLYPFENRDMLKKIALATTFYALVTMGWLVIGCETKDDSKQEYAEEQVDASKEADKAEEEIQSTNDTSALADVRDDLTDELKKLEAAKKDYLAQIQTRQKTLNEKISDLDPKVTDPKQPNRQKWVERRTKYVRQRDQLQASLMELQKPMTGDRWSTAEGELKELISAIDEDLQD